MRKVSRSAIVPHTVREMYSLVDDIEAYPDFLPWCKSAVVLQRDGAIVEATLELQRGGISKAFTTRNKLQQDQSIALALLGGPFRHLSGGWAFQPMGETGCKVSFDLEFEFENPVTDVVFGRVVEAACNSVVDAFTHRADDIYGRT